MDKIKTAFLARAQKIQMAMSDFVTRNIVDRVPEALSSCEWCGAPNKRRCVGCKNSAMPASLYCSRTASPAQLSE